MPTFVNKPEFLLREKLAELDPGRIPYDKMPMGSVIDTVYYESGSQTNLNTQTTWTETNLYGHINTKHENNKVLISGQAAIRIDGTSSILRGAIRLKRRINNGDYETIWPTQQYGEMFQGRGTPEEVSQVGAFTYLDEPNAIGRVFYRLECYLQSGTTFIVWDGVRGTSMALQEIKG